MKKILAVISLMFVIMPLTIAYGKPSIEICTGITDKYIRDSGVLYEKPAVQTDVFISLNGLYFDLWKSVPTEDYDKNYGTEEDGGLGWTGSIFSKKLTIDIGATYINEPKMTDFGAKDLIWWHAKFVFMVIGNLSVTGTWDNYEVMPNSSYPGGNYISLGIGYNKSLFNDHLNMNMSFAPVYNTANTFGISEGYLLRGIAELNWKLTEHFSVTLPRVSQYTPVTEREFSFSDRAIFAGVNYKY